MGDNALQASFNSGEWSPNLYARVDLQKYRSAAALLQNFYVDYRGGASTRFGTRYLIRAYKPSAAVRLIPFQASFTIGYALEFGDFYIRFHTRTGPVLETGFAITAATKANPCVITVPGHDFAANDWIYVSGVGGMTQLNGHYFFVLSVSGNNITLGSIFDNSNINSTGYSTYTSGGLAQRVFTLASPYAAADLALVKYAQNVADLILCHPNYPPQVLTYTAPTNWSIGAISFGTSVSAPGGLGATTTLSSGSTYYSYVVTTIDEKGEESDASAAVTLSALQNLATTSGTNTITWTAVTGAASYNVYKANTTESNPVPAGVPYGFIGNVTGTTMADSNIGADFTVSPPIARNPFAPGSGVTGTTITANGSYGGNVNVTCTFAAPGSGIRATGVPRLTTLSTSLNDSGGGYVVGNSVAYPGNLIVRVDSVDGRGGVVGYTVLNAGNWTGTTPNNPMAQNSTSGVGTGFSIDVVWGVGSITITNPGSGYGSAPTVSFSPAGATATSTIGDASSGYPSVPAFFQQRLVLAAPLSAPQTMYMSRPGFYYNFDVSSISQPDDAITASIVSGQLNNIKSMVPQPAGLIVLTDGSSWLVNGGSFGSAVTPSSIVANAQSFNGANDVPPIVVVYDILYVQSKGSSVRDSLFNFYANVYTGTDISVLSSQLFFGFTIREWAWAEEPFKLMYAIRNDGALLTLTFLKEQDFVGWAHSTTQGTFNSVCTIIDQIPQGSVNGVYTVTSRLINGSTQQYIERFADRYMPNGVVDAWCVDCGLSYSGSATANFSGGEQLAGLTCTGLADGQVIDPFVMPADGNFTLPSAASQVVVGLPYICDLQTLALDLGEPTVQGKVKKIPYVDIRVADTLGLKIGNDFDHLVDMKDLIRGNVSSMLTGQQSQIVTDLITGDARTFMSPAYTVPGQYCLRQDQPLPATILGAFPAVTVGDTSNRGG